MLLRTNKQRSWNSFNVAKDSFNTSETCSKWFRKFVKSRLSELVGFEALLFDVSHEGPAGAKHVTSGMTELKL